MNNKLVLFDIDGTLIYHIPGKHVSFPRFLYAIRKTFSIDAVINQNINYNGWVDMQIIAEIVRPFGVSQEAVMQKSAQLSAALHEFVIKQGNGPEKLYIVIPEAVALAEQLLKYNFLIGLLTGNVERMARWKLSHAGVPDIFPFGLFGDDVDNRIILAKTVFEKANRYFGITFLPKDIVVVGDAIGDIQCAKAIGATTIITMTGRHVTKDELAAEHPDLLVDTLSDHLVYDFFHLSLT